MEVLIHGNDTELALVVPLQAREPVGIDRLNALMQPGVTEGLEANV